MTKTTSSSGLRNHVGANMRCAIDARTRCELARAIGAEERTVRSDPGGEKHWSLHVFA